MFLLPTVHQAFRRQVCFNLQIFSTISLLLDQVQVINKNFELNQLAKI